MRYHVIDHWNTVASEYPRGSIGNWKIADRVQTEGIYKMQEENAFYYVPESINLTVIEESGLTWFTDEPRNMYSLAEIGLFRARGHVVVGGLGLGLIHSFLILNPRVKSVTTIEIAPELKYLVWPYVRTRLDDELIIGDFYNVLPNLDKADTIITDFIFGSQNDENWEILSSQKAFCKEHFPDAQFLEQGYQARMDADVVRGKLPSAFGTSYDVVKVVR